MLAIAILMYCGWAMECGSQELLCQALAWLTENELAARKINDLVVKLGQDASGGLGAIVAVFKDYGQSIIGLLGFSFGVWRWWLYHDRVLHKRLDSYISARDARLRDVRDKALNVIQRPGPGQSLVAPSFVNRDLKAVLRESRWDNSAVAPTVLMSADWQLGKAITSISDKLFIAEREAVSLRQELCTALSLRGAVASARTGETAHSDALSYFRRALGLPGHANDVQLKELEAHQLHKLRHFDAAKDAYERVVALAQNLPSERDRDVIVARAKRYLAEIEDRPFNAYLRMRAGLEGSPHAPGPIVLLDRCQPLSLWEWVEKGDMHYLTALLAREHQFNNIEANHLEDAEASYEAALRGIKKKGWDIGRSTSRLRKCIRDGRQRVALARRQGTYDKAWLPRWSDDAQKPTAEVGGAGGDQAVAETA